MSDYQLEQQDTIKQIQNQNCSALCPQISLASDVVRPSSGTEVKIKFSNAT